MRGRMQSRRLFGLWPWIVGLTCLAPGALVAMGSQGVPYVGIVTADEVVIRAGAGETFYQVGTVHQGARVHVDEIIYGWYKIKAPEGTFSYISSTQIDPDPNGHGGTVMASRAAVKSASILGPGDSYRRQIYLLKGDRVQIAAEDGGFYKIIPPQGAYVYLPPGAVRRALAAELISQDAAVPVSTKASSSPTTVDRPSASTEAADPTPVSVDDQDVPVEAVDKARYLSADPPAEDSLVAASPADRTVDLDVANATSGSVSSHWDDGESLGHDDRDSVDASPSQSTPTTERHEMDRSFGTSTRPISEVEFNNAEWQQPEVPIRYVDEPGQARRSSVADPVPATVPINKTTAQSTEPAVVRASPIDFEPEVQEAALEEQVDGASASIPSQRDDLSAPRVDSEVNVYPELANVTAAVREADRRFRQAQRLPLEEQPIGALVAEFEALWRDSGLPAVDRQVVATRLTHLLRNARVVEALREISHAREASSTSGGADWQAGMSGRAAHNARDAYDFTGQLLGSAVYNGTRMPRLYRLVATGDARTIAYVRPGAAVPIGSVLGHRVGIVGRLTFDSVANIQVIEVQQLDVLDQAHGLSLGH